MKADIIYRGRVRTEQFPMNSYQLADLSDQMRCEFPINVRINSMFGWEKISNEFCIYSPEDMLRFNLFAQRFEQLSECDEAKMYALMKKYPKADAAELLDMTYGLNSVDAYVCCNDDDFAELAFNNNWLPVFEDCPYDILDYLDSEKVAEEVADRREGYMYNGYYIEIEDYKRPQTAIELPKPETGFFRLLLASDRENKVPDREKAEWLTLPCSKTDLENLERRFGCRMNKMICIKAQSALPMLAPITIQRSDISELNDLANKMSGLSHFEFIKLKAVMELGEISSVYKTSRLIDCLHEFGFDPLSMDASVYGKVYLFNNLPVGFDTEVFADVDMEEFGRSILCAKRGGMTLYGAVTGRGQSLFTPIAKAFDEEETEDIEDDESENESEELGECLT